MSSRLMAALFVVFVLLVHPIVVYAEGTFADAQCPKEDETHKYAPGKPKVYEETKNKKKIKINNLYGLACTDVTNKQVSVQGKCIRANKCEGVVCGGKKCAIPKITSGDVQKLLDDAKKDLDQAKKDNSWTGTGEPKETKDAPPLEKSMFDTTPLAEQKAPLEGGTGLDSQSAKNVEEQIKQVADSPSVIEQVAKQAVEEVKNFFSPSSFRENASGLSGGASENPTEVKTGSYTGGERGTDTFTQQSVTSPVPESNTFEPYNSTDNPPPEPVKSWYQQQYENIQEWTDKTFAENAQEQQKQEQTGPSVRTTCYGTRACGDNPAWADSHTDTRGRYFDPSKDRVAAVGNGSPYKYGDKLELKTADGNSTIVTVRDNCPGCGTKTIDITGAAARDLGSEGDNSRVTVSRVGDDVSSSYARETSPWSAPIQDYVSIVTDPPFPVSRPAEADFGGTLVPESGTYNYPFDNPNEWTPPYEPSFDPSAPYALESGVSSFEPYAPFERPEFGASISTDGSQEAFENAYTSTQPLNDGSQEAFENAYTNTQPINDGSQEAFENAYTSTQPIEGLTPEDIQQAEEWQRNERLAQADREYQQYLNEQMAIADTLEGRFIDTPPVLPSSQDIFEGAFTSPGGLTDEAHLGIAGALENSYTNQFLPSSQDIFEGAFTSTQRVNDGSQDAFENSYTSVQPVNDGSQDAFENSYTSIQPINDGSQDAFESAYTGTQRVNDGSQEAFENTYTNTRPLESTQDQAEGDQRAGQPFEPRTMTDAEIEAQIPKPDSVDITARKVMNDIRDAIASEQTWSLSTLGERISDMGKSIGNWFSDTFGAGDKGIAGTDGGLSDGPALPPEGGAAEPAGSPVPYAKPDLAGPDFTQAGQEYDRQQEQAAIARELEGRTQGPLASSQDDFEGNLSAARPLPSSQDAFEGAFTNSQPLESTQDQAEGDQRAGLPSEESLAAERMADERRAEFGTQEDKGLWEKFKDGASKLWSDWFGGGQPDAAGIDGGLSDGPIRPPEQAEPTESEKLAAEMRGEREPFYSEERKDMERQRDGAAAALKNMLGPDFEQKIKNGDPLVQPGWKEGGNVIAAKSAADYVEAQNKLAELDGKPAPFPPKEESSTVPPEEKSKWEQQQRDAEARLKQYFGNDYKDVLKDGKDPRIQPGFKEGVWPDAAQAAADYKQAGEKLARIEEQKFKEQMAIANEREGRTEGPKAPSTKVAEGPKTEPPAKEPPAKEPPVEKAPPAKTPPRIPAKWEPKPRAQQPPSQEQPTGGGTPSPSGGGGFGGGGGGLMDILSKLMESLSKLFGQKKTVPPTQPPVTPPIAPPIIPVGTTTPYLPSIPPPVLPPETPPGTTTATTTPPKKSSAVVTLIANPSTLKAGGKTTLTWAAINAIQCDLFGPTGILLGSGYPETKVVSAALSTTSNFNVRCTAKNGDIISGVTTVTVK